MIQSQPMLGELCSEDDKRDAIHIAIAPVIAGVDLEAGDWIGRKKDGTFTKYLEDVDGKFLGVVDPFLTSVVKRGERFWILLIPYTVKTLRHVWSAEGFEPKLPVKE